MEQNPSELILASGSPRRTGLLAAAGIPHRVVPSRCRETWNGETAERHVARWAAAKAADVAVRFPAAPVLGVDTTVAVDGRVLDKPAHAEEAAAHLAALSGRWHTVLSGVCFRAPRQAARCRADWADEVARLFAARALRPLRWSVESGAVLWVEASAVRLAALSEREIADYVATGEPLDKAGAYAIQGLGGRLVERISGSWSNVVGLPMETFCEVYEVYDGLPAQWHRCRDVYALALA